MCSTKKELQQFQPDKKNTPVCARHAEATRKHMWHSAACRAPMCVRRWTLLRSCPRNGDCTPELKRVWRVGGTAHSHRPPDWIWALAAVRPGHQWNDCALASLAGCLGVCAGKRGAGAPPDMAATSLHNAGRLKKKKHNGTRCCVFE